MPTYEYECTDEEHHRLEISRPVDERDNEYTCPCGSSMYRIYNAPAIKFNGTGFYSTGG